MIKRSNIYRREEIEGYESLEKLALDFFWSWNRNHCAFRVWEQLDPNLWAVLRNPWIVLQTLSRETLEKRLADPTFRKLVDDLVNSNELETKSATWFQKKYASSPLKCVAYFCMEYMLGEALPIYSGGLGNVAGDQLKAASDLGVPVIAIGLLYQQGYFRQTIDKDGWQHAVYPYNDPGQLPIRPLRTPSGEWLRFEISLPGFSVWVRAWEVKVGRVRLYLLDTNDVVNYPTFRGITSELYGGDAELRLKQELILGIGGWRLLQALGIKPEVCHLNEGHAAFAILERAISFMNETGVSFEIALTTTRAGNLFTTHTAVPAGFDRFSPALIEQYLGVYAKEKLGLSNQQLLALGRQNPNDPQEPFNMAYLAIRGSGAINGVSKLHGCVSRQIFEPLFPRWPEAEVPVGHVTNGVHMPSWASVEANILWAEYSEPCQQLGVSKPEGKTIRSVPDNKLWQMRNNGRKALIEYARIRLARMWETRGFSKEEITRARHIFDPNTLTLGFARRFATYKRPNMLLHDPDRLLRILTNANRPVQLMISGKAHPADKPGQAMIREWIKLFDRPEARAHVIFLSDYDMSVTEHLVQGVDLWLNTPRRPWEACGTSGMKVLANGGLNFSELDGWWVEAYTPEVGWALGDTKERGADPAWDAAEANALYDILEHQVVPEFYTRDPEGIPTDWLKRIRNSMAELTPRFSANRAVTEYAENHYIPAAAAFLKRSADKGAVGKQIASWHNTLEDSWDVLRFGEVKVSTNNNQHTFEIQVYLDDLDPAMVRVELYGTEGAQEMKNLKPLAGTAGMYIYGGTIQATHPPSDYTPRIVPHFEHANVPLEASRILWQR